jgi:hypothetical protein
VPGPQRHRDGEQRRPRDGTLPVTTLGTWLTQDFRFEQAASGAVAADLAAAATYADPGFEALAPRLEGLLDQHARDTPAVRATYRRAMHLEVAFFGAALSGWSSSDRWAGSSRTDPSPRRRACAMTCAPAATAPTTAAPANASTR